MSFAKLWTASAVSNIGDGVTMVAAPLLVASLTPDPVWVAWAVFVQQLPWLLFALVSGALVDRVDRRRLIVTVNVLRGLALGGLALAVATDMVSIPVVYVVFFLLGTGETLADTASAALLPAVVPPEKLAGASAKLVATFTVANQFVAKPLGAWLFVTAAALPFAFDAVSFFVAAALVALLPAVPGKPAERLDVLAGIRWLLGHRVLRTLAMSMGLANFVFCAAFAIFVLYARQQLGLSAVGYGVLLTTFAVGGLLGTLVAPRLSRRFGDSVLLRTGLVVEALTHLTLAITDQPLVAGAVIVVFGVHTTVWGVVVGTLRLRVVPDGLLGRALSAYSLLDVGGAALGSLLGGLFAQALGVTAPFWAAAGVMVLVTVVAWRPLREA